MKRLLRIVGLIAYVAVVVGLVISRMHGHPVAVLNPQGVIATKERDLIMLATLLMLIVVIPVFVLTAAIAWRYRAGNTKAVYQPEWDHHRGLELAWWAIPSVIIGILAVVAWQSSHELDPYVALASTTRPLTVQVVAMQWKWLFIYPEQHVASVNVLELPQNTPVNFQITADAPMNSFWIPQLGGQIYAMPGMATQLHLIADHAGDFDGYSANISGSGFASMHFVAQARSSVDFSRWVAHTQQSDRSLDVPAYNQLARPGTLPGPITYAQPAPRLFDSVMMKFMMPSPSNQIVGLNQQ